MSVSVSSFGTYPDGREIKLYTISNKKGMQVSVTNIGAALVKVMAPDGDGRMADVVLGFDKGEDYMKNPSFMGVVVGPSANRIAGGAFTLDGVNYKIDVNDGANNLHSHKEKGWHKRLWESSAEGDGVTFTLKDEEGNLGFPGEKKISVTYLLDEENALTVHYHGVSDKRTILNPTNHTYFNLEGHDSGSIEGHELWLGAARYTPADGGSIPTGEIVPVEGTPMDFREYKAIGRDIEEDYEALNFGQGYDHNWVLKGSGLRPVANLRSLETGIAMEVSTDLPGMQFYVGNFLEREEGKGGAGYLRRHGACFETQYFPDAVHKEHFEGPVVKAGETYDTTTVYRFYQMP